MKLKPVVASLIALGLVAPALAHKSLSQQAVIDQNSVITPTCFETWTDHVSIGGTGKVIGLIGSHNPAGTFTNLGTSNDLYVNNLNLVVNGNLSSWSKATVNIAYLGSPTVWTKFSETAYDRVLQNSFTVDEAYVQLGNFAKYPFYFVVGKKYVPFGDYSDPYAPYQVMSPTQMMTQTNAVTAILGASTDFGLYANLYAFRGTMFKDTDEGIKNFGAKIGYHNDLTVFSTPNVHLNVAASYMHNIWDSQVFNNSDTKTNHPAALPTPVKQIDNVKGLALHADVAYNQFTLSANLVKALNNMALGTTYSSYTGNSKSWAADVGLDYACDTFGRSSHFGVGGQFTGNTDWMVMTANTYPDWAYLMPKWRVVGEYKVNVFKHTDFGLTFAYGKSLSFPSGDTYRSGHRSAVVGLANLTFKL